MTQQASQTSILAEPAETVIESGSRTLKDTFVELWQRRELLGFFIWRDLKVRYKQTVLGAAWAILQPTLMMLVFCVFLGQLGGAASSDVPYALFVFTGLLPWSFFSAAVSNASMSVVSAERMITKVYFPRLAIPFASVGAALADFCFASTVLIAMMAYFRTWPGLSVLLMPVLLFLLVLAGLGIGSLLAALNVTYRDFRYVVPFLLQIWMFATPSIYLKRWQDSQQPSAGMTGVLRKFAELNPLTGLIAGFRATLLDGAIPWASLAVSASLCVVVFVLGCWYFRRVERTLADII